MAVVRVDSGRFRIASTPASCPSGAVRLRQFVESAGWRWDWGICLRTDEQ